MRKLHGNSKLLTKEWFTELLSAYIIGLGKTLSTQSVILYMFMNGLLKANKNQVMQNLTILLTVT